METLGFPSMELQKTNCKKDPICFPCNIAPNFFPRGDRSVARLTVPLDQVEQVTLQVRLPSWKANEGLETGDRFFFGESLQNDTVLLFGNIGIIFSAKCLCWWFPACEESPVGLETDVRVVW